MTLSFSYQGSLLTPANFFVFALYDSTAPTVLLEKIAPPKPYGNPIQGQFLYNCINGHNYILKVWESPDDTATGIVRNETDLTARGNVVTVRDDEYLQVDVTADLFSGTNTYINPTYENWDIAIGRVGAFPITPESAADISAPNYRRTNADDSPNDLGSKITLLDDGVTWQSNETWYVTFKTKIEIAPDPGTPSPIFGSGRIITANETLTSADVNNCLLVQSATSKISLTLPLLSDVVDFSFLYFNSQGGSHKNAVILAQGSDKISYNGDRVNIILGQREVLRIYKGFGKWQIEGEHSYYNNGDKFVASYLVTETNCMACDGSLKLRTDYPRLWEWVQSLGAGVVVTDTVWTSTTITRAGVTYYTKKGCFSTGDGSTTFRVPLIQDNFIRPADGSTFIAGQFRVNTNLKHIHLNGMGNDTTGLFVYGGKTTNMPGAATRTIANAFNADIYQGKSSEMSLDGGDNIWTDDEAKPNSIGYYQLLRF